MNDKTKPAKAKAADKAEAEDAKSAETPAWQLPDYAGSLTIEQAQWRQRNIKPVAEVRTK